MKQILIILRKEIFDNLRDKRSVFFAFFYGPILMPLFILGPMVYQAQKQFSQDYERPVTIHVDGRNRALNLFEFLRGRNIDTEKAPENFREPIRDGDIALVMEVAETYPDHFTAGKPARVVLHYNNDDGDSQRLFWRVRGQLEAYNRTIASQRMTIRGFDRQLLQPVHLVENELSRDDMKAGIFARMVIFTVVLSITLGGLYLAIDTTTGEKEHYTLEPLLSLAVTRFQVTMGKYLAILTFVAAAFITPMVVVAIASEFIPASFFGPADPPGPWTFVQLTLLAAPICLFITGLMMALAAFARSNKEAQTLLGFAMVIPIGPIAVTQFMDIHLTAATGAIPILGHGLIAEAIVTGAAIPPAVVLRSILGTIAAGVVLYGVALHLYRRDDILE